MNYFKGVVIVLCFIFGVSVLAFGEAQKNPYLPNAVKSANKFLPQAIKGAQVVPGPFVVQSVQFSTIVVNNRTHLVAAVMFNRNVDASSIQENVNIRLLKQNENNFWVDASTQNNTVNIRPNFITWVSGAPLASGVYKMHLRGTIRSADGVSLDCDGDGKGEGGYPPPYESQLYQSTIMELEEIEGDIDTGSMFDRIRGRYGE